MALVERCTRAMRGPLQPRGLLGCWRFGAARTTAASSSSSSSSSPTSSSLRRSSLPSPQAEQRRALSARFLPVKGAASWVDEASVKPVSQDTLAGIPWAGRSTLTGLFLRVASHGPKDPLVWKKLAARADVIAHSLTPKQAALILSAMVRSGQRPESFLRRFSVKFVPSLIDQADLVDLCGIISSLSQLGAYCEESFNLAARRLGEMANQLDARQLSLLVNAYVRCGHHDAELFEKLLKQVPRRLARCTGKDAAVLLNAMAQLPHENSEDIDGEEAPAARSAVGEALRPALEAIALRLPDLLPEADLHSMTLILNAFAQLGFVQKDVLDLLTEELLASDERLQRLSPRQLAMVLNAAARLQLYEPRLLELLASKVRLSAQGLDSQALCVVANACAKLQLGLPTFQVIYAQVPRHLARLSGRQLAMLCHAWAKAHVHNDDLFALLALPLAQRAGQLTAHEVATAVYGYAHFKKSPPELFTPLLERFSSLLEEGAVRDGDLLMLANALGRVGVQDESVGKAISAYAACAPDIRNLSIQAVATFGLADLAASGQRTSE
ncbi:unnamed protein product [Polarella glacialis]|uniref:RNA-editing substrate-binding complex 6 protein domain-containing protein n=1 Tax=Polarella glacialis TaxID=89957 RepID=A0A813K8S5_POLGL|nr:unnamed protein product [Polarella glacialis]CAE8692922.1 unnamed protein product [Polarella glacialis]